MSDDGSIRVLFTCSSIGITSRGVESFFREAFDGLKTTPGLECRLLKGGGHKAPGEHVIWCLPKTTKLARWLGKITKRNGYVVEQWSSFPAVVAHIRRFRPHVIFYSDCNLGFQLYFRRKWIGVPYRLLYSNGGPLTAPFVRTHFVQQLAPLYYDEALKAGEPVAKHFMVPLGFNVQARPTVSPQAKLALRKKLGLPPDKKVVLSVGWISREHKRMHYVVEEIARLPQPRPFLQILGAMDDKSWEITDLASRLLGPGNFSAASVSYEAVGDYYDAADHFVLGSLKEAFGRVYIEALMHGLPVMAHRYPAMEYVVGKEGLFGNFEQPGALADLVQQQLLVPSAESAMVRRWESVRDRFSWSVLTPQYYQMFKDVLVRECKF